MLDVLDRYGPPPLAAAITAVMLSIGYLWWLPSPSRVDLGLGILFVVGVIVGRKARGELRY